MNLLELASAWTLAQPAVECVVPTLHQEADPSVKNIEAELEELAKFNRERKSLPPEVVKEMTRIGDNRGTMSLKGGSPQYSGEIQADQWPMTAELEAVARRWNIVPDRDLYYEGDPRDLREKGAPQKGIVQATDRRLYMQLQAFGGCANPEEIKKILEKGPVESVIYVDVNDPQGIAILFLSENPGIFVREVRCLLNAEAFKNLKRKPELTMFGRSYSTGREADLEDWLLKKPRRNVFNPKWPWAVWYPLRRKPEFELLSKEEQGKILFEHAMIGRNYGQAGYAADIRLACYGLDEHDNEFVIGLVGPDLHPLSRLVQDMRKTQQTAKYMQSLGPFFIGRVFWQSHVKIFSH